jgi:hypothetical protein
MLGLIWLWVIGFIILIIVLVSWGGILEKTKDNYDKVKWEIESLDNQYESLKDNMLSNKEKLDSIWEQKKAKIIEKECLEINIEHIIKWEEVEECNPIASKKKTIVLKKK